jgi:Kef-type K+ transport system membrane component KefB
VAVTPLTTPLLTIGVLFFFAKMTGILLKRFGVPTVVGEILGGMLIGPYAVGGLINRLFGAGIITIDSTVELFSQVAVILIIFSAAAENGFSGLRRAGLYALLVAIGGAVLPFFLGFYFFIEIGRSIPVAILLGSTMAATSLAVTAQSLSRLEERYGEETNLIINAAAIDDVVSIILLAVALTIVSSTSVSIRPIDVLLVVVGATATWFAMLLASLTIIPQLIKAIARLRDDSLLESASLAIAFALSSISTIAGLSTVVGAYLAGLSMNSSQAREHALRFSNILKNSLGPLFFAVIGAQLNFTSFLSPYVVAGVISLTAIAVFGKAAGAGIFSLLKFRKLAAALRVGVAMIPRGEVGLVIAGIALQQNLLPQSLYAEIMGMVMATTVIGPIGLERLYHVGSSAR